MTITVKIIHSQHIVEKIFIGKACPDLPMAYH